jgi:hypothetical protein
MTTRLSEENIERREQNRSIATSSASLLLLLRHYHAKYDHPGAQDVVLPKPQEKARA